MHVIALSGMARVGKTEVADIIEMEAKANGMHPLRISFSTPLKYDVAAKHDYTDPMKFKKEQPEAYRHGCQSIGAEMRAKNPDHWVNKWVEYAKVEQRRELTRQSQNGIWEETVLIVDDCRYLNELEAVKQFDAVTVFIYAGRRKLEEHGAPWRVHESEELAQRVEGGDDTLVSWFDWSIYNDGTQADLEDKLDSRLPYLLGEDPGRFANACKCTECQAFRFDVQAHELIEGFREALREIQDDNDLDVDAKRRLLELFTQAVSDLESGKITPKEMFRTEWWINFNPNRNGHDDDDDAEDSDY
tara:strand:- start:683 stop:1588 length:906 start_codon:yes stop_codon:yes gene_type:complete